MDIGAETTGERHQIFKADQSNINDLNIIKGLLNNIEIFFINGK